LLNTIPWVLIFAGIENGFGMNSEVCVAWLLVRELSIAPDIGVSENDDVVTSSEGVTTVENRLHHHF